MTDYGHPVKFGVFPTPVNDPPQRPVELAVTAERAGLDLVTFQDHPYQPRFHDTWTLLSYVAARTSRVAISANVHCLPLRPPAVLARSAASLDLLSAGRFELGLGAGAFWDAIVAMGGVRLTPGQSLTALEEAIAVIRAIWDVDAVGAVRVDGEHHRAAGAKRGPRPAHAIPIRIGGYGPRMVRLIGRLADGWLPSLGYLRGGLAQLAELNARIDEAAAEAGRAPAQITRLLNISGRFDPHGDGILDAPPAVGAERLADLALEHGMSGFILAGDDDSVIERFAAEVVPATREAVETERERRR